MAVYLTYLSWSKSELCIHSKLNMQSPLQTLQVNALFACDLPTKWYHEHVLDAIITLATSGIPCTYDGASAMVYLR